MKALSIRQPWASLIVAGFKPVENRTWNTHFRGEFLIHAGKEFDKAGLRFVLEKFPEINIRSLEMPQGGIIGKAKLVDVINTLKDPPKHVDERIVRTLNSPWFFGPVGFIIEDPVKLRFMPCAGALSFFEPKYQLPSRMVAHGS